MKARRERDIRREHQNGREKLHERALERRNAGDILVEQDDSGVKHCGAHAEANAAHIRPAALHAARDVLPLRKLVLLDNDAERVATMGGFIRLLLAEKAPEVELVVTTDRREAFTGMEFLFAQIRSGGLAMRAQDEQIPLRHGVVGQETCGPGGFAFALRSIPDMLAIGEDVRRYAPDAWILNYSNPAAILADLWHKRFPELKSLFICDMPIVIELLVAATLGYRHADLAFDYVGLNHFGWWRHIWNPQGEDLLPQLRDHLLSERPLTLFQDEHVNADWVPTFERLRKSMRLFPEFLSNTYLQYYYFGEEMVAHEDPHYSRANRVIDTREKAVFEEWGGGCVPGHLPAVRRHIVRLSGSRRKS